LCRATFAANSSSARELAAAPESHSSYATYLEGKNPRRATRPAGRENRRRNSRRPTTTEDRPPTTTPKRRVSQPAVESRAPSQRWHDKTPLRRSYHPDEPFAESLHSGNLWSGARALATRRAQRLTPELESENPKHDLRNRADTTYPPPYGVAVVAMLVWSRRPVGAGAGECVRDRHFLPNMNMSVSSGRLCVGSVVHGRCVAEVSHPWPWCFSWALCGIHLARLASVALFF
jgi:hypothetical protein